MVAKVLGGGPLPGRKIRFGLEPPDGPGHHRVWHRSRGLRHRPRRATTPGKTSAPIRRTGRERAHRSDLRIRRPRLRSRADAPARSPASAAAARSARRAGGHAPVSQA